MTANNIRQAIINAVAGGATTTLAVSLIVLGEGGDIFSCDKPVFNGQFRQLLAEGVIIRRNGGWAMPVKAEIQVGDKFINIDGETVTVVEVTEKTLFFTDELSFRYPVQRALLARLLADATWTRWEDSQTVALGNVLI
jgi:hypothetical protein